MPENRRVCVGKALRSRHLRRYAICSFPSRMRNLLMSLFVVVFVSVNIAEARPARSQNKTVVTKKVKRPSRSAKPLKRVSATRILGRLGQILRPRSAKQKNIPVASLAKKKESGRNLNPYAAPKNSSQGKPVSPARFWLTPIYAATNTLLAAGSVLMDVYTQPLPKSELYDVLKQELTNPNFVGALIVPVVLVAGIEWAFNRFDKTWNS